MMLVPLLIALWALFVAEDCRAVNSDIDPATAGLSAQGPLLPCGFVLMPNDPAFVNATYIDNGGAAAVRQPSMVVMAQCPGDVAPAMAFAQTHNLSFTVKGGGHSAAGYSLTRGGLVLDMSGMNSSRVLRATPWDTEGRDDEMEVGDPMLFVEAGAYFGMLYERLNSTGLILAGGGCSAVGVSGFFLGGGLSFLGRAYGIGSDNIVSIGIILANGTQVRVSAATARESEELEDLWWALRGGGGGNFGVVVDMVLRLHEGEAKTEVKEVKRSIIGMVSGKSRPSVSWQWKLPEPHITCTCSSKRNDLSVCLPFHCTGMLGGK